MGNSRYPTYRSGWYFQKSQFLQFPVDPSRHIITVQDKIPIFIRTGFSPELLCRKDGGYGEQAWENKERTVPPGIPLFFQYLIRQLIQDLFLFKARAVDLPEKIPFPCPLSHDPAAPK